MGIVTCPQCGARNRVDEQAASNLRPKCGRCGAPLDASRAPSTAPEAGTPITVTDATLESLLRQAGDKPVLVDCWAEWCPPCRAIAPVIDQIGIESRGRWLVGKLDVDANPRTASTYNIQSIPALLIFHRGQLVDQLIGLQPKPQILARLEGYATGR